MSPDTLATLGALFATVVLTGLNALYVFHEFAFVMLKPPQIRALERSKSQIERLIARMAHDLDHYIAVDQLGITVASIAIGWVGQPALTDILRGPFEALGIPTGTVPVVAFTVAFIAITSFQMIAGELMPKSIALRNPTRVARGVAVPVELTARVMHPFVWALNGLGNLTVRALGFAPQGDGHGEGALPVEELLQIIQSSARAGALEADPMLLRRALHFSDLEARDLIVPRQDVVAIALTDTIDDILETARNTGFTRYPVYEETIDRIIGVLNVKDLVQIDGNGEVRYVSNWRRWIRPIPALPEHASIEQVLARLSAEKQPMVLLLDEYGGTSGILTAADIADELTGGTDDIRPVGGRRYIIKGETAVTTVEATLDIALGDEDRTYDSMGGLVMEVLGRIPSPGDRFTVDDAEIEVLTMRGRRVIEVSLTLPEAPGGAGSHMM